MGHLATYPPISVTPRGTAMPVAPVIETPELESRLSEEIRRQAAISLAVSKLHPVPKGTMK